MPKIEFMLIKRCHNAVNRINIATRSCENNEIRTHWRDAASEAVGIWTKSVMCRVHD